MKKRAALFLAWTAWALLFSAKAFALTNLLSNPNFELPLGDTIGEGNWNSEANRGILQVTGGAPEGNKFMRLSEPATVNAGFVGVFTFQVVRNINPGNRVALSGLVRVNSLNAGEAFELRLEFKDAGDGLISTKETQITSTPGGFTRFSVSEIAPATTAYVVYVMRIQPSTAGDALPPGTSVVDVDAMAGTVATVPLVVEATPASSTATAGDIKLIAVNVVNDTAGILSGVELEATPQAGLNIRAEDGRVNGAGVSTRRGSVIFNLQSLQPQSNNVLSFPVIITSGITPGRSYTITLQAQNSEFHSAPFNVTIQVRNDPVFSEGTILGKVFQDTNKNTVQDAGEEGVPWVRLATEGGVVVVTDEYGRYHIPAIKPGRHLLKIDSHSLPAGTQFISEETYEVKTTEGMLNKANFAVLLPESKLPDQFKKDLSVSVTQGLDTGRPKLEIEMTPPVLRTNGHSLTRDGSFKITTNYPDMIAKWVLEVRDEQGLPVWSGTGDGAPPHAVSWQGQTDTGDSVIRAGLYSYQLKVQDEKGREDWSLLHFFRVVPAHGPKNPPPIEMPAVGNFNIYKDGKQTIPLIAKPTVRVQGKTRPKNRVEVNGMPVDVNPETGVFEGEFFTVPGEQEVRITATDRAGESTTAVEKLDVKDSTFFMVALGEETLGVNFQEGNSQTMGEEAPFRDGFYEDGRSSFYLKGKIKGKFLVKSHYDTGDKRDALFTNLDPEKYYPVYGDNSTRDYEAQDTLQRFYFLVEADRSFLRWGSYKTGFTDTELSNYDRTLSGLKGHYESLKSTKHGDPHHGVTAFYAKSKHMADHNEFAATGGSLFYLRNRRVIEGSEKLRVEVRDKIQGITIASRDLQEGADYDIDYDEGRVILARPLSSVSASDTLMNNDTLDGNPVFLVADYEADAGVDAFAAQDRGVRGFVHLSDFLRLGGTIVDEERRGATGYQLRGVDTMMPIGRNTRIRAEYAETLRNQTDQAVSYNGGLSFEGARTFQLETKERREKAYMIKGETKPWKPVELTGYLQSVEPSFSVAQLMSQNGQRKYGGAFKYSLTDHLWARYRVDASKLDKHLIPVPDNGVAAAFEDYQSHTLQATYDGKPWLVQAEYQHQEVNLPQSPFLLPSPLSEFPLENGVALKVGHEFNERVMPYVKTQLPLSGKSNYQYGGGVRAEVGRNLFGYLEEMFGPDGDSTYFGFEKKHGKQSTYSHLRMGDRGIGRPTLSSAIGSSYAVTERSRLFMEREHSGYHGADGNADILGYQGRAGDHWDYEGKFERRRLDGDASEVIAPFAIRGLARNNNTNVVSGALAYADGDRFRARTFAELQAAADDLDLLQTVLRDVVEWKFNSDWTYLGKFEFGKSDFTDPDIKQADYAEFSTGFAYRPVFNDRLNILSRYTLLREFANKEQFLEGSFPELDSDQTSHILASDVAYDINRYFGLVEKAAFKTTSIRSAVTRQIHLNHLLLAQRVNFHVTRKWDVAVEYRGLWQYGAAQTFKHGALTEVDREIYNYVRFGIGYNFTDFSDDLESVNNVRNHGPFVRLTGKF